jgi:hypothetical protein
MISRREFLKLTTAGLGTLYAASRLPIFHRDLSSPAPDPQPVNKGQGVLGVMPSFGWKADQQSWNQKFQVVNEFETALGRKAHLISLFSDLEHNLPDSRGVEQVLHSGRAMMINLMPRPTKLNRFSSRDYSSSAFTDGNHDQTLTAIAKNLSSFGNESIFIRFAFEMNGDWVLWHNHPSLYVNLWRHVVDLFRSVGADNVKWVFSPNNFPSPEDIGKYYPGSSYVDAVGPDIYRWDQETPEGSANQIFYYLKQVAPDKPLMVNETGATEVNKEGEVLSDRDEWLTQLLELTLSYGSGLFTYFDFKKTELNSGTYDWRLRDPGRIQKLSRVVNSEAFLHESASLEEINNAILQVNPNV